MWSWMHSHRPLSDFHSAYVLCWRLDAQVGEALSSHPVFPSSLVNTQREKKLWDIAQECSENHRSEIGLIDIFLL